MANFSDRLKELRKINKVTQKQVAHGVGIAENHYQFYEHGKQEPTISKLITFCNYFQVSADYLLGLSDDPTRR